MSILKPLKAADVVDEIANDSPSVTKARDVNVFASLGSELNDAQENDQLREDEITETVPEASDIAQAAPVLDDDELGQWIELSFFIYVSQALNYNRKERLDVFRKWIPCWNASTDIGKKQRRGSCQSLWRQRCQHSRFMQLTGYLNDMPSLQQMPLSLSTSGCLSSNASPSFASPKCRS